MESISSLHRWPREIDLWLPLLAGVISLGGMLAIHSAESPPGSVSGFVFRQAAGVAIGFALFAFTARTDYRAVRSSALTLHAINLLLLTAVIIFGDDRKGAQRWIDLGPINLQPSEISKVLLLFTLGAFLDRNRNNLHDYRVLGRSLIHLGVPMLLILRQPDMGTSLVLIAVWFTMTFAAGARLLHLAAVFAVGLLVFAAGWRSGLVKEYQKTRLIVFLDPGIDPRGSGYHINQSRKAIGSGQVFGKGWRHGDMKRLEYVPENHTDFIFTVVGEETGFAGSVVLLGFYFLLIARILLIALGSEDSLGQVIAAGVAAMFTFHTVVNIGMTIGVMPVTGVPLPLFSYGPSAIVASLGALGVVESVHLRRHKIGFR